MARESDDNRRRHAAEEASLWLGRLERILKPNEGALFREWLKEPVHREVILSRCKLWHGPEILAVLLQLIPDIPPTRPWSRGRRFVWGILFAAAVLGFSMLFLTDFTPSSKAQLNSLRAQQMYQTPIGIRRRVGLPDGSTMILNTASHVLISYGLHSRDVTLVKGEASFNVIQDPSRPFIVSAGIRQFTTGRRPSRFNLRLINMEKAALTVMEGQVLALRSSFSAPLTPKQLRAQPTYGEHIFNSMEGGNLEAGWNFTVKFTATEIRQRLAWQQDSIIFTNETLEEALKEFERYTTTRFVFADEALRGIRLSAELQTGDVKSLLRVLRDDLQIDSASNAVGDIVLSQSET